MNENENIESNDNQEDANTENEVTNESKKSSKKSLLVIATGLIMLGIYYFVSLPTVLENASDTCDLAFDLGFSLDEDGKSAYMDGKGEEDSYLYTISTEDQVCILDELEAPTSVYSRISNTNSLMGVQEAEWDNIKIRWTYHPDNGLDISIDLD